MELCEHGNSFHCQSCEVKYLKYVIEELQSKVGRYEKALQFFANKDYYEPWREEDGDRTDAFNFIDLDGGETAREALNQRSEESEFRRSRKTT